MFFLSTANPHSYYLSKKQQRYLIEENYRPSEFNLLFYNYI